MGHYTVGVWTVKDGRGADFERAWQQFAEQTKVEWPALTATLLRDRAEPNRYISFGPWDSVEDIAAWRESEVFKRHVPRIVDELLDGFVAYTADVAVTIV